MYSIPADRLPPGFAESVDRPPEEPAVPRPAATVVFMRDAAGGPEALLLRRNRSSGFVPGAYVFPGGRVDEADTDPRILRRADGLAADATPRPAYWIAAVREAFEEAGVLLAVERDGRDSPDVRGTTDARPGASTARSAPPAGAVAADGAAGGAPARAGAAGDAALRRRLADWRDALLDDRATLHDVLEDAGLRLAFDDVAHCAHWITPVAEPRRYDTHFFLARWPDGHEPTLDPREMTDAVWLTPADALERFRDGRLPMVFPTVKTLESFSGHDSVDAALDAFRGREIEPVLPRLVRTEDGVGIVVD